MDATATPAIAVENLVKRYKSVTAVDGISYTVERGETVAIVAGTPMGVRGTTNFMKFHVIGGDAG